ncbi:hypothetical protein POVWA2_001520 [Plasmodium ovale wallikeri]|uniref:Uncharacterized protein n=1 Tax=Plasmodium ovale wallikeri TaxID=864142 RepID=A0A1A8YH98_PLAOA|nr:hypothetical protein POVWA2_001520 [Plasmodium ovale wallikeri]
MGWDKNACLEMANYSVGYGRGILQECPRFGAWSPAIPERGCPYCRLPLGRRQTQRYQGNNQQDRGSVLQALQLQVSSERGPHRVTAHRVTAHRVTAHRAPLS